MQKSQFTDEQIVAVLQQAEKGEKTISEVCRSTISPRILSIAGAPASAA